MNENYYESLEQLCNNRSSKHLPEFTNSRKTNYDVC